MYGVEKDVQDLLMTSDEDKKLSADSFSPFLSL